MNQYGSGPVVDPVLLPFLHTASEREAARHLDELIAHAAPGIARITKSSRTPEDAFQEATHRLIRQLREMRTQRGESSISNYLRYVKVVASRVVKGQVREEHPRHRSMVDALRHVLKREPSMALWKVNGHRLCGFAEWRDRQYGRMTSDRLTRLLDQPRIFGRLAHLNSDPADMSHVELLAHLFAWIRHAVRFDELTRIVCGLRGIRDHAPVSGDVETGRGLSEWLPDERRRPDEEAEWKEFLGRLWARIEQLPWLHRLAYLLNFTAADGQLELFWSYGVASIRRIGAAAQLTGEQFSRVWPLLPLSDDMRRYARESMSYDEKFALLWQYLPLTDSVLAALLETDRQKVINLRKAAGNRLSRDMAVVVGSSKVHSR